MSITAPPMTSKPRRRWLRFSLRAMMMVMLAFGLGFGWIAMKVRQAREQRQAIEAIEKLGGSVWCFPTSDGIGRKVLTLVERLTGEELYVDAVQVSLPGKAVRDGGLSYLSGFTGLRQLFVRNVGPGACRPSEITKVGMTHLQGLTELERLYMNNIGVTDDGLGYLRGLTQLKHLEVGATDVTDAGLKHLHGLTQLEGLNLSMTEVTDAGLEHLNGLTRLEYLNLDMTKVTDAGLEHLQRLTQLRQLDIGGTAVTDAGVAELQRALPGVRIR
jgi:hypothetical protein